jgi:hypothetical protein
MDARAIIVIIEKRRDRFRDAASVGTGVDTLVASAAQVAWDIAGEHDSLLAEIESACSR